MSDKIIAYCLKCKEKKEMNKVEKIITKNGRNAAKGFCPICGTKMFKFLPKE